MTPVIRLLAAASITNSFTRNISVTLFHRKIKIQHMTTIPLRNLLTKNLRIEASGAEALYSTHVDLIESHISRTTQKVFRKAIMEPYLNSCYASVGQQTCATEIVTPNDIVINHESTSLIPTNPDLKSNLQRDVIFKARQKYKSMRSWKRVGKGLQVMNPAESCIIRLFSYNILAQHLIQMHSYLYKHHDQRTLDWEMRRELLILEIIEAQATVICLQEMQEEHLTDFVKPFQELGYKYLYKKRTNDKKDGLLLMYRSDIFNLVEFSKVEFYQSGLELLNRDNVAIIVKLSLKDSPPTQVVIATTHLLYNPKRDDVRLGQTQILMAELERIAFLENTLTGPSYHPIIISGDFNLEPYSGVYEFITEGSFQFMGKSRTLGPPDHRRLSNSLIPPHLLVTDGCQHYHVLVKRLCNRGEGQVMLQNSEITPPNIEPEKSIQNQFKKTEVDIQTPRFQQIQILDNYSVSFGSGYLTHPFRLQSVYSHIDQNGKHEATTCQDKWITVDYIFFSNIILAEIYTLPTLRECKRLSTIPNHAVGSDHLSVGATFVLHKKRT